MSVPGAHAAEGPCGRRRDSISADRTSWRAETGIGRRARRLARSPSIGARRVARGFGRRRAHRHHMVSPGRRDVLQVHPRGNRPIHSPVSSRLGRPIGPIRLACTPSSCAKSTDVSCASTPSKRSTGRPSSTSSRALLDRRVVAALLVPRALHFLGRGRLRLLRAARGAPRADLARR